MTVGLPVLQQMINIHTCVLRHRRQRTDTKQRVLETGLSETRFQSIYTTSYIIKNLLPFSIVKDLEFLDTPNPHFFTTHMGSHPSGRHPTDDFCRIDFSQSHRPSRRGPRSVTSWVVHVHCSSFDNPSTCSTKTVKRLLHLVPPRTPRNSGYGVLCT